MASTSPFLLPCLSILVGFLAMAAQARPGRTFHPCNTLIVISTTTTSFPIEKNPNFDTQNPFLQSSSSSGGRFVTLLFTEVRRVIPPRPTTTLQSDPTRLINHAQMEEEEEDKLSFPFGLYSSSVGASIRDRTNDILSVVESLLFGVGCGALTASIMYLIWTLFIPDHVEFVDYEDETETGDHDIDASPKKMGYVPIAVAKEFET
ncbi:uncharacterized protein LOC124914173 [Impatiens glandulifera]|uniref:uncharacterized protein LOC124914173 n=1 Tax=Impatiens glandulifera TaxID=253017 RepID=UPI001FB15D30|nr:uncharacterized protein LOC124914173 [Impatiens glandulifera]